MKLFVFYDILYDYSGGLAFAIAETKEDAIKVLMDKQKTKKVWNDFTTSDSLTNLDFQNDYKYEEHELTSEIGYYISGGA